MDFSQPSFRFLRRLIVFCALVLHPCSHADEVSYARLFSLPANENVIVLVEKLSDDATVNLASDTDIQLPKTASISADLYRGALFVVTASNKPRKFKVTVERRYQSELATSFKLLVLPLMQSGLIKLVAELDGGDHDLTVNAIVDFSNILESDYQELGLSQESADRLVYYFAAKRISVERRVDLSDSLVKCLSFVSSLSLLSKEHKAHLFSQCHFRNAVALMDKGLFRDSLGQYELALLKLQRISEPSSRLSVLKYFLQGRVAETLYIASFYEKDAAGIAESGRLMRNSIEGLRVAGSYRRMAEVQNIFAYYLDGNGEHAKAIKVSRESVDNHKKAGPNSQMAASLNNLALLLHNSSRTSEAIEEMVAALNLKDELGQAKEKGAMLRNLGRFYLSLGDYESAQDTAELALELALERDSPRRVALSYHLLGSSQLERQEFELAKQSLLSSEASWQLLSKEGKEFSSNAFSVRVSLIRLYTQLSKKDQAIEVFKNIKSDISQMIAENVVGDFKDKSRFIRALLCLYEFELAFGQRLGGINAPEILRELMSKPKLNRSLVDEVAQFYYLALSSSAEQNDLQSARDWFRESLHYLHQVEANLNSIFVGPTLGRIRGKLAGLYLNILVNQYEISEPDIRKVLAWEALAVAESVAGNTLTNSHINSIKQINVGSQRNMADSGRLQVISTNLDSAIAGEGVSNALASQAQEVANLSSSVPIGLDAIDYKELNELEIELKILSKRLAKNDLALTFFKSGEFALVLALEGGDIRLHRIKNFALLNMQINMFRKEIRQGPGGINILMDGLESTLSLKNVLESSDYRNVLIKTHGEFNFLPVSAILNNSTEQVSAVRYIRIGSLFAYLSDDFIKYEGIHEKDFSVFVSPEFSGVGPKGWVSTLNELSYSQTEASFIIDNFPSSSIALYSDAEATKANVLSNEFRLSTVGHISTHGYFDPNNPSIVGFATSNSLGNESFNFVSVNEVLLHNYALKLLVVSGCETYLGKDLGGWGLMGLSNAFIAKGTGSVISTLWPVPDRSTSRFMSVFYAELANNEGDVALALGVAKNALKKSPRFKSPFYWGAFVLTSTNQQFERIKFD